jgi:transcriptional antiterminator RfaH
MKLWYLLYTKPHKEPLVNRQLEDRGIDVFFPTLQFDRGYNRGIRLDPFFPHYLFAQIDMIGDRVGNLQWLVGMRTIVYFEGQPAIVPETVVDTLRQRLQPYENKVLRRGEWLFKPGQRVKITNGPFTGLEAIFQQGLKGAERVQILLDILGSSIRTEISSYDIKPV